MVRHAPIHRRSGHSDIAICCGRNVRGSSPSTSVVPLSNQVTTLNHKRFKGFKMFSDGHSANSAAQPLMPPLFFINVFNGIRFLTRATYRSALDHLLMVLLSSLCSHVQRITAANGSAFVSTVTPANLYARRMSFLVRCRPL